MWIDCKYFSFRRIELLYMYYSIILYFCTVWNVYTEYVIKLKVTIKTVVIHFIASSLPSNFHSSQAYVMDISPQFIVLAQKLNSIALFAISWLSLSFFLHVWQAQVISNILFKLQLNLQNSNYLILLNSTGGNKQAMTHVCNCHNPKKTLSIAPKPVLL